MGHGGIDGSDTEPPLLIVAFSRHASMKVLYAIASRARNIDSTWKGKSAIAYYYYCTEFASLLLSLGANGCSLSYAWFRRPLSERHVVHNREIITRLFEYGFLTSDFERGFDVLQHYLGDCAYTRSSRAVFELSSAMWDRAGLRRSAAHGPFCHVDGMTYSVHYYALVRTFCLDDARCREFCKYIDSIADSDHSLAHLLQLSRNEHERARGWRRSALIAAACQESARPAATICARAVALRQERKWRAREGVSEPGGDWCCNSRAAPVLAIAGLSEPRDGPVVWDAVEEWMQFT